MPKLVSRRVLLPALLLLALGVPPAPAGADEGDRRPARETLLRTRLKAVVTALCDPALGGRGAWAKRRLAADDLARRFQGLGLQAIPGRKGYFDDHGGTAKQPEARNVVGWLPGAASSAETPGPYILVSAHYDHLGVVDGTRYPGADDNASGVAVMLEVARALAARKQKLPVGVLFVAFDLEEQQLIGSRRYCESPPMSLDTLRAFVTFDMMGRSVGDLAPGILFLMGTEHSPEMEALVDGLGTPEGGRRVRLGIDFQPGYSDYVHFAERKVPYLFVTSGACADYHRVGDTVDKIDWAHLELRTKWSIRLCEAMAKRAEKPLTWKPRTTPRVEEIRDLSEALTAFEPQLEKIENLPPIVKSLFKSYRTMLTKALEDDVITETERKFARSQALMLFNYARQLPR